MKVEQKTLGVAVVGLGVGEQHARAYLESNVCELRWLYDLDSERTQSSVATLGRGEAAQSFEQVLDDPSVDVVSIASYDDAHFEQVLAALEAGKHVFVEKPLCRTMQELTAIKRAWSKHDGGVKLSSNLVLRAAPVYAWLREKIDCGELGTPYAFDGEYLYGRLHKITDGWRRNVCDYSVILGGGIHLIDLLVWITGERPSAVYASGNRISTEKTAFRYKDYVAATLECPSGLTARITANFGSVHRHHHAVRVFTTEATFIYDDAGPRLHTTRDPSAGSSPIGLATLPATKGDLIGPFVSALLDDSDMAEHTQEMFDVISICAATDAALESGSKVEVDYV